MPSKVFDYIAREQARQDATVELIASENFVSENVLRAVGSCLTNKYAEGYPAERVSGNRGRYYGGGSTPVPEARMTDGVLHTVLVKNVSKARFATLFGGYSAGDYKKLPQDIIRVSTAKVVRIEALEGDLTTCLDGESMHSQCVTLKLADKKVNFFAPKGCDPDATAR